MYCSSRNSEVVHAGELRYHYLDLAPATYTFAGLYYPTNSLKMRLCLRGRQLMYDRCEQYRVPYRKTGKLVVACNDQLGYIECLHAKASGLQWPPHSSCDLRESVLPTKLITGDEARDMEPDLSKDIVGALWSPETGIVDTHSFMETLEKDIIESENGELVYSTKVVRVDPYKRSRQSAPNITAATDGWVVQTVTGDGGEGDAILARTLINSTGLSGPVILNSLLPENERIPTYFARGSYASYHGPGVSRVSHLIYPCPDTRGRSDAFHSLGTHLTLDLQGKIRFGPDLDWLSPPDPENEPDPDFWHNYLVPDETKLKLMYGAVQQYLPGVFFEGLQPDYCGIRPKLVGPTGGFQDFEIRTDRVGDFLVSSEGEGGGRMINLLGIESPGLTSSLAIAELVVDDMLEEVDRVQS